MLFFFGVGFLSRLPLAEALPGEAVQGLGATIYQTNMIQHLSEESGGIAPPGEAKQEDIVVGGVVLRQETVASHNMVADIGTDGLVFGLDVP